jgi:multidrug resistance efflux pump
MKRYLSIIILPLLIALVLVPIDVPYTLDSIAKVMPARQWIVVKLPDGSLTATLYDHRTGLVSNQEGYQFDRGDLVQVQFKNGWTSGSRIRAGETVATIFSNQLGENLVQLRNQLAIEQANLGVVASGQKPQVLRRQEEEINLARADLELRKKMLERMKQLRTDGLVAAMELEQAENAHNESLARVRVAESALEVSATGEKQETVSLVSSRIASLQKEIAFLENKQRRYALTAPFDGQVRLETAPEGDRLLVEDTAAAVLHIPVRLRDLAHVRPGQKIALLLDDNRTTIAASILEVGSRVEILNREQVVAVKAASDDTTALPFGAAVRCQIECGKVRVSEFLKRSIRWQ